MCNGYCYADFPILKAYSECEGRLVSICEIGKHLSDKFRCPDCDGELIPKLGDKRIHHFAHKSAVKGCKSSESEIHKRAKEILLSAEKIWVPKRRQDRFATESDGVWLTIDEAVCEKRHQLSGLVPDVTFTISHGGRQFQLYVEICNTHAVDEEKAATIKKHKMNTLEIYLDEFVDEGSLENLLVGVSANKRWVYQEGIVENKKNPKAWPVYQEGIVENKNLPNVWFESIEGKEMFRAIFNDVSNKGVFDDLDNLCNRLRAQGFVCGCQSATYRFPNKFKNVVIRIIQRHGFCIQDDTK